jgi:hypothetical protein
LCSLAAAAAASSELESLTKQAGQNYQTKEGQRYLEAFQKGIMPAFGKALDTCSSSMPDTKEPASIAFVVGADGTVKRVLYSTDIPFGQCVGSKIRAIKTLPKPPHDNWVVAIGPRTIITKKKQDPKPPRTDRRPPAARSRWRHTIGPSLLTSRRLGLLTLRLRSIISLAYHRVIRSRYGLGFTKMMRKLVSIVTKMSSLR